MKLKATILTAALAASTAAYAGHREAKPAIDPAVCPAVEVVEGSEDAEVIVVDDTEVVDGDAGGDDGEVVDVEITTEDGEVTEGEVVEGEVEVTDLEVLADGSGEPCSEVDPAVCEAGGPEVQRGGEALEDPSVIFQTAFLGGVKSVDTPVAKGGTPDLGQEDRATAIEAKGAGAAEVNKEKKGPVALVNKGRVFLR